MKSTPRPSLLWQDFLVACLLVVLAAALTYRGSLDNFFSASDSLTLIQSGRLGPDHGLADVLTERMMAGTSFAGVFYRPISVLSFDLDYELWHLNPFGYHLTNLLLHILVAVMVLVLGFQLTGGRWQTSLLAALLFTWHPVLVETVPAIARRQDILDALFLLLSFATYLQGRRQGGWRLPVLSVVFFILALGSKETGIQIPGLIFAHALIYARESGRGARARLAGAARAAAPYFGVTAVYLVWRIHVLGGIGSDGTDLPPLWIAVHFFAGLIYPQDFLGLRDDLAWLPGAVALVAALGSLVFLVAAAGATQRRPAAMKLPLLLTAWLVLPLPIFAITGTFAYRSLYTTVIPFSLLLGVILGRGVRGTGRNVGGRLRLILWSGTLVLAGSLVAFSPLWRDYPLWRQSGQVAREVLQAVTKLAEQLPAPAVISVEGLPQAPAPSIVAPHPRAHSVSYLRDYSIRSWLALQGHGKEIMVRTDNPQNLPPPPCEMELKIRRTGPEDLAVRIVWLRLCREECCWSRSCN